MSEVNTVPSDGKDVPHVIEDLQKAVHDLSVHSDENKDGAKLQSEGNDEIKQPPGVIDRVKNVLGDLTEVVEIPPVSAVKNEQLVLEDLQKAVQVLSVESNENNGVNLPSNENDGVKLSSEENSAKLSCDDSDGVKIVLGDLTKMVEIPPIPTVKNDKELVLEDLQKAVQVLSLESNENNGVNLPSNEKDGVKLSSGEHSAKHPSDDSDGVRDVFSDMKKIAEVLPALSDEGNGLMHPSNENKDLKPPIGENDGVKQFLRDLKKGRIQSSNEVACETIKLLERMVSNSKWETAKDLINIIRNAGQKLNDTRGVKHPSAIHTIIGNMVRRVLKIIRDEYFSALGKADEYDQQESLQKIVVAEEETDFTKRLVSLQKSISANLRELTEEFERSPQDIARQSEDHIHSDEVILTYGYSKTVEKFLKKAAAKRKCQVIVAEGGSSLSGHTMAKILAESGIPTTLIQDAFMRPIMPRVNKVIVSTHAVMANGGLKVTCGVHRLALAAKYHHVPFIVLAPLFKLTPQFVTSPDQEGFNHMLPPEDLISFEDDELLRDVEIFNPAYDYIPPDLVTLFIFNIGANTPSYVYRLLSELYHPDDYEL